MHNLPRPPLPSNAPGQFYTMADGARLFVHEDLPAGPVHTTIFVVAGITGINHERDADVIEALSATGVRVVVIHPRGTGYSDGERGTIEVDQIIADAVALLPRTSVAGTANILFGHSMSTGIALAVARSLPAVHGLVLVNPPYRRKQARGMSPTARDVFRFIGYSLFARRVPIVDMAGDPERIVNPEERCEAEARAGDPVLARYFSMKVMVSVTRLLKNMPDSMAKIEIPTLLIHGTADAIVDPTGIAELRAARVAPGLSFVAICGGPHGKQTVLSAAPAIHRWIEHLRVK